jgi:hypothetical protein
MLNLSDTAITDAGVAHLQGLTELKQLDVRTTAVTGDAIKRLKKALPRCNVYIGQLTFGA